MARTNDTKGKCMVCEGRIVELFVEEYNPMTDLPVFGPRSENQFREVNKGYHCEKCGLKYQFVPPANASAKT